MHVARAGNDRKPGAGLAVRGTGAVPAARRGIDHITGIGGEQFASLDQEIDLAFWNEPELAESGVEVSQVCGRRRGRAQL